MGKEVIVYFDGLARNHAHVKFGFVMEVLGMLLYITDYLTPPPNGKPAANFNKQDCTLTLTNYLLQRNFQMCPSLSFSI